MSAIYYCDECGKKMRADDHERIKRKRGSIRVEVMTAFKNTWNAGNICHKCIIKTINTGNIDK